jgi:hypothetical protein
LGCSIGKKEIKKIPIEPLKKAPTALTYCKDEAKIKCTSIFNCCTHKKIEEYLGENVETISQCYRDIELKCDKQIGYRLKEGTVDINGKKAKECLNFQLPEKSNICTYTRTSEEFTEICKDVFKGTLHENERCKDSLECFPGLTCIGATPAEYGFCRRLPQGGKNCLEGMCAEGYYCKNGVCARKLEEGERCDPSRDECAKDLFCYRIPGEDEDHSDEDHFDEDRSDDTEDLPDGICKRKKENKAPCDSDRECLSGSCIGSICPDGSVCEPGERCPGSCMLFPEKSCYEDGDCKGRCKGKGDECWRDSDCPGRCETTGEPCTKDWHCGDSDAGPEGKCIHEKCEGLQCTGGLECQGQCAPRPIPTNYCDLVTSL